MSERALATIRKISECAPIEGADFIELVHIDGWQCVSKKGEFSPGDFCVYFEVDSFLPVEERYEFLRKSSYKKLQLPLESGRDEGFRLKTMKMRGQISQGLALPLSAFPEDIKVFEEGDDITEYLKVEKYEPALPVTLSGTAKGRFPSFLRKTDEPRIQNLTKYFHKYPEMPFEITEKLDGSSMTVYLKDDTFGVCSRNLDLTETEGNTFWTMARDLNLEAKLKELGRNLALQGELVGEGIQKNRLKIRGQKYYIFNIFDIDAQEYLTPSERYAVLAELELDFVPVVYEKEYALEDSSVQDLLELAEGKSLINSSVESEGIVFKSLEKVKGEVLHFKAISNKYLLKHGI